MHGGMRPARRWMSSCVLAVRVLRLRIRDDGPGEGVGSAGMPGHGLLGMRERAQAGRRGTAAGPAAGGGFLVDATFPMSTPR